MRKLVSFLLAASLLLPVIGCAVHSKGAANAECAAYDLNADGYLTTDDAVYLLLRVMFGDADYPVAQTSLTDTDGSGATDTDDAVYLLLHIMFGPEDYPLGGSTAEASAKMELMRLGQLQYYLYTPKNPTADMPLIVYLHGGTNKRLEVSALLTTEGFPKYLYEGSLGDLPAYVAVPKLSENQKGWADIYEQIRDLVKHITDTYHVSASKISLTGHSMGGTGTFQLQTKLPNTFACVAPLSGSIKITEDNISLLATTKLWAFVGTDDTIVDPSVSQNVIKALQERNADAQITVFNGATHFDVPEKAYKESNLVPWLISCGE